MLYGYPDALPGISVVRAFATTVHPSEMALCRLAQAFYMYGNKCHSRFCTL